MDKVVHFEIPADDVERAQKFYKSVFGWEIDHMPEMNYTIVRTVKVGEDRMPVEKGAINGGMMKRGDFKSPVITIQVDNIEKAVERVKKQGGSLVQGKQSVGDMGFSAYIKDSEGNVIGLWQSARM